MTLETGIRGKQSVLVTDANTAKTMGSGTLEVFATPALVALAEKTCWMSVADALGEGNGSVGTKLELEHTAPTPVGRRGPQAHLQGVSARRERPRGRRHPRALCGERRKVCRQGRGEEGVKGKRARPLSHLRCQLSQGESPWQNRELYRTAKGSHFGESVERMRD